MLLQNPRDGSKMARFLISAFMLAAAALPTSAGAQTVTLPAGMPLRVQVDHRYRVKRGRAIEGRLIAPVYSVDHKVLPVDTIVKGTILGTQREPQPDRVRAMLDGEFRPPAVPQITFTSVELPSGQQLAIRTSVTQRDATVVKMSAGHKRPTLRERAHEQIENGRHQALDTLRHPNVGDRLEKWIYAQLPWHPQTIWTGTQYDAELTAPVAIPGSSPAPLPLADLHGTMPTGLINARLTVDLNSGQDHRGTPVTALLTAPLLTPDGRKVIFPAGTQMDGVVTLDQRARWWGRNGRLRFTFRSIEVQGQQSSKIHGQLAAAEAASSANVKINDEGTAQSSSGPGKYLAPMALGMMTAASYGDDAANPGHSAVISNGFGFAARIAAMAAANPAVGRGFAYYALSKSIYYRWIARGHEIDFPKDTRIQIQLNKR